MKKTILFLLLVTACFSSGAQSPGYLGKKFSFSYGLYLNNTLSNPNFMGSDGIGAINLRNVFTLDYVLARKFSLGVSFHYFPTMFSYKGYCNYEVISGNQINSKHFNGSNTLKSKMNVYGIGINPKFFLSDHIAPLGSYLKPELLLLLYTVNSNIEDIGDEKDIPDFKNYSPYKAFAISLEFGKNYILFNRLMLDFGFQAGLVFNGSMRPGFADSYEYNEKNYYNFTPKKRLIGNYLFNARLGIGFLVF